MAPSSVPVRSCWGIAIHWLHTVFGFHQISSSEVKTHALLFYVNYSFLKLYNLIVFCYSFSSSLIFVAPITPPLAIVLGWLSCPFDVSHTCNFEHLFIRISHWGNLGPVGGRLEVMRVPIISCPVLPGAAALHTSIPSLFQWVVLANLLIIATLVKLHFVRWFFLSIFVYVYYTFESLLWTSCLYSFAHLCWCLCVWKRKCYRLWLLTLYLVLNVNSLYPIIHF